MNMLKAKLYEREEEKAAKTTIEGVSSNWAGVPDPILRFPPLYHGERPDKL